jgi:hypothetical protein
MAKTDTDQGSAREVAIKVSCRSAPPPPRLSQTISTFFVTVDPFLGEFGLMGAGNPAPRGGSSKSNPNSLPWQ